MEILIAVGVAVQVLPGQEESGDRFVVKKTPEGLLTAVIDGLGHGRAAAAAARAAAATLNTFVGESVESLIRRCHENLLPTRGVVMSLGSLNAESGMLSWLGVGNVETVLISIENREKHKWLPVRPGVVGYDLPGLLPMTNKISSGDLLIFATDGVRPDFLTDLNFEGEPQSIADRIMAASFKGNDDALVLVVRFDEDGRERNTE